VDWRLSLLSVLAESSPLLDVLYTKLRAGYTPAKQSETLPRDTVQVFPRTSTFTRSFLVGFFKDAQLSGSFRAGFFKDKELNFAEFPYRLSQGDSLAWFFLPDFSRRANFPGVSLSAFLRPVNSHEVSMRTFCKDVKLSPSFFPGFPKDIEP
jgi:hypothetical protein